MTLGRATPACLVVMVLLFGARASADRAEWPDSPLVVSWRGNVGLEELLNATFEDCEQPPTGDPFAVWRPSEIRTCKAAQKRFRSELRDKVLVIETDAWVEKLDAEKQSATIAIKGWDCNYIQRASTSEDDLVGKHGYVVTAVPSAWWHDDSCPWKPQEPLVARRVVVELSDEELADLRAQLAGEADRVQLRADLALRLERVVRIRANSIRIKFFERWITSKPVIEAIKAMPVGWRISIGSRVVAGP